MQDIVNLKGGKQDWKNCGSNLVGGGYTSIEAIWAMIICSTD